MALLLEALGLIFIVAKRVRAAPESSMAPRVSPKMSQAPRPVDERGQPEISGAGVESEDDREAGDPPKESHGPAIAGRKVERKGPHREGVRGEKEDREQHQDDAS